MSTSSSIRDQSDVEIPRGKFVEITSILKDESTWKLWHRFEVIVSNRATWNISIQSQAKLKSSFPYHLFLTTFLTKKEF